MASLYVATDVIWRIFVAITVALLVRVHTIRVVNEDGMPVPGAVVEPYTASTGGERSTTDEGGEVEVTEKLYFKRVQGLRVTKDGYQEEHIDVWGDGWPEKVTLRRP